MVSFELLKQMRDFVHQFLIEHRFSHSDLQVRLLINGSVEFVCGDCTFLFKLSDSKKDYFLSEFTFSDDLPF